MAKSILFFGDGSLPLHPAYSRVLQASSDGSLLSLFLNRARLALQDEISKTPILDRQDMPDLAELESLVLNAGDAGPDHQCLAPALLVITQLGQFISWYEARPQITYPDSTSAITIGLCVGQLSAVAVSLARSLTELLPLAVESVRLAFRTGLTAITVRDELEQQRSPRDSWAMTVSRALGLTDDGLIETIHRDIGITQRKKAYVSASFRKALTLQGPPSTLDRIEAWLSTNRKPSPKNFRQRLPIYTPYHAPHLYSTEDIERIMGSTSSNSMYQKSCATTSETRLVSPVTGEYYQTSNRMELLKIVLYDVLRAPIEWENVTAGCVKHVVGLQQPDWVVRAYGPTLAVGSLVQALKSDANANVVLDDFFASSDPAQKGVTTKEPIAIVGMAGRFPEAMDHDELWKLLENGIDCHKVIPSDRFDASIYTAKNGKAKNPIGASHGCFMKKPGMFDARFFNLSPKEAEQTDPQQRLALTTAYEALEMSGFVPNRTPSTRLDRIGTYYGQTGDDYREMNVSQDIQTYYISGNDRAFGPGRINHHFRFGGPSMSIDTACSSSAVALNVACTALWANDCDTALVGGMTLATSADTFCGLSRAHFLNETGNCKTFDDAADGYCRGEAVATVVVKRLSDAQADNDNVLAVILAAGTNYSAASASITHPHGPTQEVLYRKLLNEAGLHPFDVDYVEMHGTGTQAGDAAEMASVSNVFAPASPRRPQQNPLLLSAVKSNIGHGESASGVTALIKSMLVLREQKIPPHVGIQSGVLNRTFPDLKARNIKIALDGPESFLRQQERKRRFLVNNFGAAGGNTAMLLEEAPEKAHTGMDDSKPEHVIGITAKSSKSIKDNIQKLLAYLEREPTTTLSDLAYTTTARRMHFPMRASVTACSIAGLKGRLTTALADESFKPAAKTSKVILTFTGQGSLYVPLARDLFELSQQFRSDIIRFNQIGRDHGFPSFLSVVNGSAAHTETLSPIQTQLATTAVQMALYRLWTSWGVNAAAVIGHSLGEYAALFACGVLSASDTLYLVGQRASILQTACTENTHCMLSVHAELSSLRRQLGDRMDCLEVACINGPQDIVLSGQAEVVGQARDHLKFLGIKGVILNTPYAFHSAQIDPILAEFESVAHSVKFTKPTTPMLSPLLGTVVREIDHLNPSYLRRHAREAVNFHAALTRAASEGMVGQDAVWLEMGPNPVCLGMVKSTLGDQSRGVPTLRKGENAWMTSAKALSFLYNSGVDINWNEYHRDFEGSLNLLHIPTYSFDEKNYWIDYKNDWALTKGAVCDALTPVAEPALTTTVQRLVSKFVNGAKASFIFESDLSEPALHSIIAGHSLNGLALCPAGVYADMALTVADYIRQECDIKVPATGINITNMEILGAVTVPVPRILTPQLLRINAVADLDVGNVRLEFGSFTPQTKKTMANAKCLVEYGNDKAWLHDWSRNAYLVKKRIQDLERGVHEGTTDKMFKKMAYQLFSQLVIYGSNYQGMQEVLVNAEELEATATLKLYEGNVGSFFASPLWIDNLAQLSGFVMNAIGVVDPRFAVYISHGWGSLQIAMPMDPTRPFRVHVKMQPLDNTIMAGNVSVFQGDTMVGLLGDVKFQKVPRSLLDTMLTPPAKPIGTKSSNLSACTSKPVVVSSKQPPPPRNLLNSAARESPFTGVLKVIAEEVGVNKTDLSDESDFSEVGVDSLMSLTILSQIRETLHLDLPPSVFSDCPTIGDLRRLICGSTAISYAESDSSVDTPPESGAQTPELSEEPIVAVVDDPVEILHTTVAEQIGVDLEELLTTDDLSALGVDSLMSLSIIAALREKLQMDIPSTAISDNFSLKSIKEALKLTSTPSPTAEVSLPAQLKHTPAKKVFANSMLLQGNPKTAKKTIFLFPDGSGSATSYAELPEIAADTCVLAINSPFLKQPTEYSCSLEEAAKHMVNEVRSRQPHGPYILAGWSAGGMYSYEAARCLIEDGESVEKLILIDSPCRTDYGPMPQDVLDYVSRSGVISGKGPTGTAPQWLVDHFQGTIRAVRDYAPKALRSDVSPATYVIWAAKGVFEDWPKAELAGLDLTDPVAAWLLKPKSEPGSQGWEKLLAVDKIRCRTVEGNHFSMVHPPNCASLARALADALEEDHGNIAGGWRTA